MKVKDQNIHQLDLKDFYYCVQMIIFKLWIAQLQQTIFMLYEDKYTVILENHL